MNNIIDALQAIQILYPKYKNDVPGFIRILDPRDTPDVSGLNAAEKKALEQARTYLKSQTLDNLDESINQLLLLVNNALFAQNQDLKSLQSNKDYPFTQLLSAKHEYSFKLQLQKATEKQHAEYFLGAQQGVAFRVGYYGQMNAGLSFNKTLPLGALGVGASADGKAQYDVFSNQPSDGMAGVALLNCLKDTPNPYDFESVWKSLTEDNNLYAQKLEFNGSVSVSTNVALSKGWSIEGNTEKLFSPLVEAKVSASVKAKLTLDGLFELTTARANNGKIKVRLARLKKANKTFNASLGGKVSISGLTDAANEILQQALPETPEFWEKIEALAKPSEYLQTGLEKIFTARSATTQSLLDLVLGKRESDEVAGLLAKRAIDSAKDIIEKKLPLNELNDASAASNKLLGAILNYLGNPVSQDDPIYQAAHTQLQTEINALNAEISQQWAKWETTLNDIAKKSLLEPLASIGEDVNQLKKKIDTKWSELLEPVKNFVTSYQQKRSQLVELLEEYSNTELNLNLAFDSASTDSESAKLEFVINQSSDATTDLYESLWRGDLSDIGKRLASCQQTQQISEVTADLISGFQAEQKIGVSFNILGYGASWAQRKFAQMEFKMGASGEVLVANSKAEIITAFKTSEETKTSLSALSFVARHPDEDSAIKFSATYSHEDESLTDGEINAYFRTYEALGLMHPDTYKEVLESLGGPAALGESSKRKAKLVSHVVVDPLTFDRWVKNGVDGELIYTKALIAMMDVNELIGPTNRQLADGISSLYAGDINRVIQLLPKWNDGSFSSSERTRFTKKAKSLFGLDIGIDTGGNSYYKRFTDHFARIHKQAFQIIDLFAVWHELDQIIDQIDLAQIKMEDAKSKIKKINKRYHAALDGWIVSPMRFGLWDKTNRMDQVPIKFLALPLMLRYLAGNDKTKVRVIAEVSIKDELTRFFS